MVSKLQGSQNLDNLSETFALSLSYLTSSRTIQMANTNMSGEHVLVTGGNGFVGRHIISAFIEQYPEAKLSALDIEKLPDTKSFDGNVNFIQTDITQEEKLMEILMKVRPTIVIHVAGIVPTGNDRYSQRLHEKVYRVNVNGTRNILAAAKAAKVKCFVYTSSVCIISDDVAHDYPNMDENLPVGNASLIYGASKGIAEPMVINSNTDDFLTCALRPSVIFGPGDPHCVPTIHRCIAKGETPFIIGDAVNLYDFSYITNVADAHVLAVRNLLGPKTAAGETFFITNGEPVPFRDFCLAVWVNFGHVPKYQIRIPVAVAWFVGLVAEWVTWLFGTQSTLSRGSVQDYTQTAYADIRKANTILKYRASVGLDEGLKICCDVSVVKSFLNALR